jgi:hypothetical protein
VSELKQVKHWAVYKEIDGIALCINELDGVEYAETECEVTCKRCLKIMRSLPRIALKISG